MAAGRNVATIDFGATPLYEKQFTITDAAITAGMIIECWVVGGDSTGQNTGGIDSDHDHAAISWRCSPGLGAAGSFPVKVACLFDMCYGTFKLQYAYST